MSPARNRRAWKASALAKKHLSELEKLLGPNEVILFCLRQSVSESDKWYQLASLLRYNPNRILASCAVEVGLSYGELMIAYIRELHQNAILKQATHTEGILLDIAVDARSTMMMCDECHGSGVVKDDSPRDAEEERDEEGAEEERDEEGVSAETCPKCKGVGEVRKVGDKDARDQFLKVQKLIDTGSKGVYVDNRKQVVEIPQSVADIIRGAQRVMEGSDMRLESGNGEPEHSETPPIDGADSPVG